MTRTRNRVLVKEIIRLENFTLLHYHYPSIFHLSLFPQPLSLSGFQYSHGASRRDPPVDHSQPTHSIPRCRKHPPICRRLHTTQENQPLQHLGRCRCRSHPSANGVDCLYWNTRPRSVCPRRHPLCVAVSPFQRPQLETKRRLLASRVPHDVGGGPRPV